MPSLISNLAQTGEPRRYHRGAHTRFATVTQPRAMSPVLTRGRSAKTGDEGLDSAVGVGVFDGACRKCNARGEA